jgi:hypothetical protein
MTEINIPEITDADADALATFLLDQARLRARLSRHRTTAGLARAAELADQVANSWAAELDRWTEVRRALDGASGPLATAMGIALGTMIARAAQEVETWRAFAETDRQLAAPVMAAGTEALTDDGMVYIPTVGRVRRRDAG